MRHLLRLITVRHLRAARGRSLLTLAGVMLGVAVVFAVDVINTSLMRSFHATIERLAGKTSLSVGIGSGVDESLLEVVRAVPGVAAATPLIQNTVRDAKTGERLMVLGVDTLTDNQVRDYDADRGELHVADDLAFLNDPHAVIVTTRYAQRTGTKVGDHLSLDTITGRADYTVRGTLAARGPATVFGGDLLLMDIFAAQLAFERGHRFDQIDVVADPGVDAEVLRHRLERAVADKAPVTRPARRSREAERLMAGFSLGLSLIGLVAMFVGAFVVYNALSIAVAQRRQEIGIWRALGATRRQIMAVFLGEGLLMGLVGALAGLGFGLVLARLVVRTVSGAISALYVQIEIEQLSISAADSIKALAVGMVAGLIAAYFPARRATHVEPSSVMRANKSGEGAALASGRAALLIGTGAVALAVLLALWAHVRQSYLLGYAVAAVFAVAIGFLSPALAAGLGSLARTASKRAMPSVMLGSVAFQRNAGRNAVAIAAFGIGLANVVNSDAFVSSMKHTTARWFERSALGDLMVLAGDKLQANIDHPLPEAVGRELAQDPAVALVDPYRMTTRELNGRPFKLFSHDLARYFQRGELAVARGELRRALPRIEAGQALAASESFAREFAVDVGGHITLQTAQGPRTFEIALIYVDYSSDLGILLTTHRVYTQLWNDTLVDAFSVYLRPGAVSEDVRARITAKLAQRHDLLVLTNQQYRSGMLEFIDGSFALMRALEIVAILVAVLGIVNTLLVSIMDRRTELGVLKAIGADASQVAGMLLTEAALIGLASALVGVCFGALFSAYIVQEVLRFQVGWQLTWSLSGWAIVRAFALGQIVTLFAAWWPLRAARRVAAAEALQCE